jgi:hypothetical protein
LISAQESKGETQEIIGEGALPRARQRDLIWRAGPRCAWRALDLRRQISNLVKPKKGETWLLMTSAWHMPRSAGIFRRIGFDVVPYPVAYRTFGDERDLRLAPPMIERVIMLDYSVHEWIGLLTYWLAGKTDAPFPAP